MLKTPDYVLTEQLVYHMGAHDTRVLEPGTFMRPIEIQYVPKHVIGDERWRFYDKDRDIFCYCRYGIVMVKRSALRQV